MNNLQKLYAKARAGLSYYDRTPEPALKKISRQCGRDEVAAIHIRLKQFRAELAMVPDWNGDEQDDIWWVIEELRALLRLVESKKPT